MDCMLTTYYVKISRAVYCSTIYNRLVRGMHISFPRAEAEAKTNSMQTILNNSLYYIVETSAQCGDNPFMPAALLNSNHSVML